MAAWAALGQAATVAQLVGVDAVGLISMILRAAATARQNRRECEQLAHRVLMVGELLPLLQDPEAVRPLAGLGDALREAHELVVSCQGRSAAYQFVMAGRQAERFRDVQSRIDSYLIVFPIVSYIGITRRLDRIYNVLVPDDATSSPCPLSHSAQLQLQLQESAEVSQEIPHGTEEFTLAEIVAAANNFALETWIGEGSFAMVYRGRLHDGREVAIKRFKNRLSFYTEEQFRTEIAIFSQLRHKHIVRLVGWCMAVDKDQRLLSFRRKKQEQEHQLVGVYEYMENGTLYDHLHHRPSSSSPVTVSWKTRIDVLLGVSRAIEHLHCHAMPQVIHRDIKSANILLDASWVPRVSNFGASVIRARHTTNEEEDVHVVGTMGYLDPEYYQTGRLKPTSDVYNLGVVMLEVLTGKKAIALPEEGRAMGLVCFALPIIEAGDLGEVLDRRPAPEPTPRQLEALENVAQTAACCLNMNGEDRLAISDVVTSLEAALELICSHGPD